MSSAQVIGVLESVAVGNQDFNSCDSVLPAISRPSPNIGGPPLGYYKMANSKLNYNVQNISLSVIPKNRIRVVQTLRQNG